MDWERLRSHSAQCVQTTQYRVNGREREKTFPRRRLVAGEDREQRDAINTQIETRIFMGESKRGEMEAQAVPSPILLHSGWLCCCVANTGALYEGGASPPSALLEGVKLCGRQNANPLLLLLLYTPSEPGRRTKSVPEIFSPLSLPRQKRQFILSHFAGIVNTVHSDPFLPLTHFRTHTHACVLNDDKVPPF